MMVVCGLVFLPGALLWLGAFQLRRILLKAEGRAGALGGVVLVITALFAVLLFLKPPVGGFWGGYLRIMMIPPVIGWFWAKRICERTARDLRDRWAGLVAGSGVPAKVPGAVPRNPTEKRAEQLRLNLSKLAAEQSSNVIFHAGHKGILGLGESWGRWVMAEELVPREGKAEINPFRSWDLVKEMEIRLRELERNAVQPERKQDPELRQLPTGDVPRPVSQHLRTGGFPKPTVRHWVVVPVGAGADSISRPSGPDVENYTVKDFEIQRICNEQQFDAGNRHYLGIQFVLWGGQLVLTVMVSVAVLHHTLNVDVTAYALGPVIGAFTSAPSPNTKEVAKGLRFWETKKVQLPLIGTDEVVRLAARAPFTWYPPLLDHFGGKLVLPEPFGLRHAWANPPWGNPFMADDARRMVMPVLRAVHAAAVHVMQENDVLTDKFVDRSLTLSGIVQSADTPQA
jgi:hypothetical protein